MAATAVQDVDCDDLGPLATAFANSGKRLTKVQIPPLGKLRFSDPDDATAAFSLCTEPMKKTFRVERVEDIVYLIDNSVLCVTQLDQTGQVVGMLAAREYPLLPSVHPTAWEEYIWNKYKTRELTARNTLFLHLLCWDNAYSRSVVDSMLKSIFMHDPYVHNVVFLKTVRGYPQLVPGTSRPEGAFKRVQAVERGMSGSKLPAMMVAERKEICPRLRVRRAVEEDNDDIIPIVERQSERIRQLYGDYYISELISRHPDSERVMLVGEHNEVAVGIMILNTQINFESLEECFELSPFAGLRHLDAPPHKHRARDTDAYSLPKKNSRRNFPNEKVKPGKTKPRSVHMRSHAHIDYTAAPIAPPAAASDVPDSAANMDSFTYFENELAKMPDSQGTTYSREDDEDTKDEKSDGRVGTVYATESGHAIGDIGMEYLDLFADDEDEVDFDIINIDPELLKLPGIRAQDDKLSKNVIDGRQKDTEPVDDILVPRKEKKRTSKSSNASVSIHPKNAYNDFIIRYSGKSNAFLLELFAMHEDYDERLGLDILEAAYELFEGRDYCVMCMPSKHVSFPLLEHFTLVTPHSTRLRFINESLYVAHVNSVRGDVGVRMAELADLEGLFNLLEHTPRREMLTELISQTLNAHSLDTYMLLSEKQPIGVIIVGPLEGGTRIRTQYDLQPEPRRPGTDGIIIGGVMSPVLEPHGRWYLRDVMRRTRFTTLFWLCQPFAKGDQSAKRNMMSLADRMVPVRPHTPIPNLSGDKNLDVIFEETDYPFAVWMIDRPLTSMPKIYVNNSIVVVGASRTGLSFIESLVVGPSSKYLTFTNITLVSEHGLPTVMECLKAADICIPSEGRYSNYYMKSVPFIFYIDVIVGVIVSIDRKKKCIHLLNGNQKYYDELVLTCGLQFQHPEYMQDALARAQEVLKGKPCERVLMDDPAYEPDRVPPPPDMPLNLFVVNSLLEANVVLRRLLKMVTEHKADLTPGNPIIVYGDCVDAYCCIAALIELGISTQHIVFVENFPPDEPTALRVNCFNDEVIDERVQEKLHCLGIKIMRKFRLFKVYTHHKRVRSVCFMDPLHCTRMNCFALFYYGLKAINLWAFKAINECGLVYDGGLVVGPEFETNDPNIFGAGTCCIYSRRLYAPSWNHKYYCSEDVGEALASIFLLRLDPYISHHPDYSVSDIPRCSSSLLCRSHTSIPEVTPSKFYLTQPVGMRWQPVMKFTSPIVTYAVLPGPMYYMKVRMPGEEVPMEAQLYLPHQGHTLVTDKHGNYFRVHLNVLHCVDAVTCLSKEPFEAVVVSQLYGKHEAFFNRLLLRYQIEQVDDMYQFFKQSWMAAMYQETFTDLINKINYHEVGAIYEMMRSKYAMFGEESRVSKPWLNSLSTCFENEDCMEEHSKRVATFRSVIDRYILRSSSQMDRDNRPADIPSECGQSAAMRNEAASFWTAVGGEKIVFHHIAQHLAKYCVPNPHYAQANMRFFKKSYDDDDFAP